MLNLRIPLDNGTRDKELNYRKSKRTDLKSMKSNFKESREINKQREK